MAIYVYTYSVLLYIYICIPHTATHHQHTPPHTASTHHHTHHHTPPAHTRHPRQHIPPHAPQAGRGYGTQRGGQSRVNEDFLGLKVGTQTL